LRLDFLGFPNEACHPAVAENQPVLSKNRMTQISTFPGYTEQLRHFIRRHLGAGAPTANPASETEFNQLAVSLFGLQFANNRPYGKLCEARRVVSQNIGNWREIPAMPAAGFKEFELSSLSAAERTQVFYSSGTTTQQPSRHFHNEVSLAIYEMSLTPWFQAHFPGAQSMAFLSLTPPPGIAPHSSLVHMFETLRQKFGSEESVFAGGLEPGGGWNLNFFKVLASLRDSVGTNLPIILLGTAFNFVHLLDHLMENNLRFQLPQGSCVLETGGYKSRSRALPKDELHALIADRLGVPAANIICEYGMSELSSQAYDAIAGQTCNGARAFQFPPWARAQIINPESGQEAGEGETGLIRIFDLANVYSVMAIQTEDLGVRRGGGFELLGRAELAEMRGCSLMSI
jgi:hypothetical protein